MHINFRQLRISSHLAVDPTTNPIQSTGTQKIYSASAARQEAAGLAGEQRPLCSFEAATSVKVYVCQPPSKTLTGSPKSIIPGPRDIPRALLERDQSHFRQRTAIYSWHAI